MLKDVYVYKESEDSNEWFMKLSYEYEDKKGVHHRIYPKVALPQTLYRMPELSIPLSETIPQSGLDALVAPMVHFGNTPYIYPDEKLHVYKGSVYTSKCKKFDDVSYMDELIKPAVCKMTIEEIEEKLGYKVEIVSKDTKGE